MSTISAGTTTPTALSLSGDTTGALTFQVNGTTTAATITAAGNVGIGTSTPAAPLTIASVNGTAAASLIQGEVNNERFQIRSAVGSTGLAGGTAVVSTFGSRGTIASPSASLSGDQLGYYQLGGYDGTNWVRSAWITGLAAENYSATNRGSHLTFATTPIGSTAIAERMRIDSSGNVGIGRTAYGNLTTNGVWLSPGTDGLYHFGCNTANGVMYINQNGSGPILSVNKSGSEVFAIANAGSTFVKRSSALYGEDFSVAGYAVIGSSTAGLGQTIIGSDGSTGINGTVDNVAYVTRTNNTERMRISSAGEVNIGSSANYGGLLSVNRAQSGGIADLLTLRDSSAGATINFQTYGDPTFGTASRFSYGGAYLAFRAATTEQMRLTSGGNLLIGTTTNLGSNTKISVAYGGGGSEYGIELKPNANNTVSLSFRNAAGSLVGSVSQDASNTAYNTSSDRRLKENIAPADDAGTLVDAIQIVKHDWKVGGHNRYGVIAQDLYEIVPEAVAKGDEGDEIEKTWGVDYSKLVPILVKEIQSLRARVAELESK